MRRESIYTTQYDIPSPERQETGLQLSILGRNGFLFRNYKVVKKKMNKYKPWVSLTKLFVVEIKIINIENDLFLNWGQR